jgi:hypothetical protein
LISKKKKKKTIKLDFHLLVFSNTLNFHSSHRQLASNKCDGNINIRWLFKVSWDHELATLRCSSREFKCTCCPLPYFYWNELVMKGYMWKLKVQVYSKIGFYCLPNWQCRIPKSFIHVNNNFQSSLCLVI